MAGSLRWFTYKGDNGTDYAQELDESNSEAVSTPGGALFGTYAGGVLIPGRLKKRYVNAFRQNAAGEVIRRKFYVGSVTVYQAILGSTTGATIAEGGNTWRVTSGRGEKAVLPSSTDTGQTDGDNP